LVWVELVGLVALLLLFLTVLVFIFFLAFLCWFLALRIERKASDADAKNLELVNMSKTPSIAKLKKGGRGKKKKKASVDLDVPGKGFRFLLFVLLGLLALTLVVVSFQQPWLGPKNRTLPVQILKTQ
jgi:hypothetical protein